MPEISEDVVAASPADRTPQPVGEERIRIRAYELYEKRGGAPGDADSDWLTAEAELSGAAGEVPR